MGCCTWFSSGAANVGLSICVWWYCHVPCHYYYRLFLETAAHPRRSCTRDWRRTLNWRRTHTHTHRALAGLVQRLTMGQTDAAELLNCMPTHCHRRIRLRSITSIRMRDNSAPRLFARASCAVNTRRPSHEMRSRTVAAAAPNTLPTVTGHLPRPLVGLAG